jgi:hypothetical protein
VLAVVFELSNDGFDETGYGIKRQEPLGKSGTTPQARSRGIARFAGISWAFHTLPVRSKSPAFLSQ